MIDNSDHAAIAHTNEGLGDCLHALKKYEDAEIYFANAAEDRKEDEAKDPYALAAVLMKQGRNFKDNGNYEKAEPCLREAVASLAKAWFHPTSLYAAVLDGVVTVGHSSPRVSPGCITQGSGRGA